MFFHEEDDSMFVKSDKSTDTLEIMPTIEEPHNDMWVDYFLGAKTRKDVEELIENLRQEENFHALQRASTIVRERDSNNDSRRVWLIQALDTLSAAYVSKTIGFLKPIKRDTSYGSIVARRIAKTSEKIAALVKEVDSLTDQNNKLHRRAQKDEGASVRIDTQHKSMSKELLREINLRRDESGKSSAMIRKYRDKLNRIPNVIRWVFDAE